MEPMSTFSIIFELLKYVVEKHVVPWIPSPEVKRLVKENLDNVIVFLFWLPLQLLLVYTFLAGIGKLTDLNCVLGSIAQGCLLLVLTVQAIVRAFMDCLFGVADN